ncbi:MULTISPECIES: hypothetical protein [Rhodococcus]|nr:hypothetical protein [Rhodococcus jostii]
MAICTIIAVIVYSPAPAVGAAALATLVTGWGGLIAVGRRSP